MTIEMLLKDTADALREALPVTVAEGFLKEPYYGRMEKTVLSLSIRETTLSDSGFGNLTGWEAGKETYGVQAEILVAAELYLPIGEEGETPESVFSAFFEALSQNGLPYTAFTLGETGFLETAQCFTASMTARGRVLLTRDTDMVPIKTVMLEVEREDEWN